MKIRTAAAVSAVALCATVALSRPTAAQESPLRLGQPRNITASVRLYRPLGVDVGPDGALFICNAGDQQIIKLSFEGETAWRVGREGQGPGEFRALYRIAVGAGGRVAAFDLYDQDLSWFEADGTFARKVNLATRVYGVGAIALLSDDLVAMVAHVPGVPEHSIHVFSTKGELVRSFGPVPPVEDELQLRNWLAGFLDRSGSNLIFTLNIPYEIHRFSPGGDLLQSVRRGYEFPEGAGGKTPTRTGEGVRSLGTPKFVPHPVSAKNLGAGWLLGAVMTEPDSSTWDLFHNGELVASYAAPNGWLVHETDPERGVLYVKDEDDAGDVVYLQVPYAIEGLPQRR